MTDKCRIFFISGEDEWGGRQLALDIAIEDDDATAEDYLSALERFAAEHVADCYGCDGCCHERAPLIAADIAALAALLPHSGHPATAVAAAFAWLSVECDGAADIMLARPNGGCIFLDRERHCCREHQARPFVCRSHFCLPQSDKIHHLRESIVNSGLDELTRLILAEAAAGAPPLCGDFCARLDIADYAAGGSSGAASYRQLRIKDIVSRELWSELRGAERGA